MALEPNKSQNKHSEQYMENASWHSTLEVLTRLGLGFDGQNVQLLNADNMAIKVTESGTTTYVGKAAPGASQSSSVWQCMKIDESSGTVVTFADGDSDFDNVATDLTALTYS